jgi:hypothetical protein
MRWSLEPLGEAIRRDGGLLQTGPFGSQLKQAEYSPEGVPVIMPKDILDGGVLTGSVARVPEATADRLSRHKIMAQGIVLPRRGEVTKRAFIRAEQEGWLCGTGCIKIEVNGKVLWPKYVYYFLGTKNPLPFAEMLVPAGERAVHGRSLARYHLHQETKFWGGEYDQRGPLRRRHVFALTHLSIGKEADHIEENEFIGKEAGPLEHPLAARDHAELAAFIVATAGLRW